MSLHTTGILVNSEIGSEPDRLFAALGFESPEFVNEIDWDLALSSDLRGTAVAVSKGWTCVVDPASFFDYGADEPEAWKDPTGFWPNPLHEVVCAISKEHGSVLCFLAEGASTTYGFSEYRDGALKRCWLFQEGLPIKEVMIPSDFDLSSFDSAFIDEDSIMSELDRYGAGFFFGNDAIVFRLYRACLAVQPSRKPWWKFW